MDQLLNNHENAKESLPAFEKAFITLDNSMVIANNILIGYNKSYQENFKSPFSRHQFLVGNKKSNAKRDDCS